MKLQDVALKQETVDKSFISQISHKNIIIQKWKINKKPHAIKHKLFAFNCPKIFNA